MKKAHDSTRGALTGSQHPQDDPEVSNGEALGRLEGAKKALSPPSSLLGAIWLPGAFGATWSSLVKGQVIPKWFKRGQSGLSKV